MSRPATTTAEVYRCGDGGQCPRLDSTAGLFAVFSGHIGGLDDRCWAACFVSSPLLCCTRWSAEQDRNHVPGHYEAGRFPALLNAKLGRDPYPMCFSGFATLFSRVTRTPIYSAEHLTAARVRVAGSMIRYDAFHAETNLPPEVRSELTDYRHSGHDRGHMAPNERGQG